MSFRNNFIAFMWSGYHAYFLIFLNAVEISTHAQELVWHSGSVMDCHAMARGSIPGRNGAFTELHILRKGQ